MEREGRKRSCGHKQTRAGGAGPGAARAVRLPCPGARRPGPAAFTVASSQHPAGMHSGAARDETTRHVSHANPSPFYASSDACHATGRVPAVRVLRSVGVGACTQAHVAVR